MTPKSRIIIIHIIGCLIFLALPVIFSPDAAHVPYMLANPQAKKDFLTYLLLLLFFYCCYLWLIPRFYFNKKYMLFLAIIVAAYFIINWLPYLLIKPPSFANLPPPDMYGAPPADGYPPHHQPFGHFSLFELTHNLFLFLVVIFLSLMLKIRERWQMAEKEKLNTELSYLKAQINPHFLFNTLNSIYSLTLEKSEDAPSAVIKLSDMMRYVITDAEKDFVPLQKEIDYISSYIELQRLRFGESIKLTFAINGNSSGKKIAPLILISFVENAFKHGLNAEENSDIKIQIDINEQELRFKVFNNKVTIRKDINEPVGLGIENTRNRLQILYPGRHNLEITDNKDDYTVLLNLNLS